MSKYIDEAGLARLWARGKAAFAASGHTHSYISLTEDWADVLYQIRHGHGSDALPVGSRLNVAHSDYGGGNIVVDVVGHDHHPDPTGIRAHTMTVLMRSGISNRGFDSAEALYYAANGLAAGTYCFTLLAGYSTADGGGKTLRFTLAQAVPSGGVVMFPWVTGNQSTATKISTYASRASVSPIETVSVAEGSGGTSLGTADGVNGCNHSHRIRFGSNNYAESAIRQWLTSSANANEWWQPQHIYDRPPNYVSAAGFLKNIDPDFAAALVAVDITTARNTVYELGGTTGGSYAARDKVFLPSMTEMGLGNNRLAEGGALEYYVGASVIDRIKYDVDNPSSARVYWLRSPITTDARGVRRMNMAGELKSGAASTADCAAIAEMVLG